jgi:hypothetical protein
MQENPFCVSKGFKDYLSQNLTTMKKNIFTSIIAFVFLYALFSAPVFGQDEGNVENNRLKLETEPALLFNNGFSINAMYNVTKNNNFGIGVYLVATDVPTSFAKNLFTEFTDSSSARATKEFALSFRYRIRLAKKIESNPYVGLILGWENFRLMIPGTQDLDIATFFVTPHIGYEFYVYKKKVYINPQVRSVFYFGQDKSDKSRTESLNEFFILPAIFVGIRF